MNSRIGSLVAALESKSITDAKDRTPPPKRSFSTATTRTRPSPSPSPSPAAATLPIVADDIATTIKAAIDEQVSSKLRELCLQNERLEEELQNTRIENENLKRRQLLLEEKVERIPSEMNTGVKKGTDAKPSAQLLFNVKKSIREQVFPQLGELFHHCARLQSQQDAMDAKQRKLEKRLNSVVHQTSSQFQRLESEVRELQNRRIREKIHLKSENDYGEEDGGTLTPVSHALHPFADVFVGSSPSLKQTRRLGQIYETDFALLGKLRSDMSSKSAVNILKASIKRATSDSKEVERREKTRGRRLREKIGEVERFVLDWGRAGGARCM